MCRRVQGSQIFKQNWIISIRSRVIVILLIWVSLALGVGQVGGGCLGWSAIVYMSSGMFRGKESSNRIELSQLVQDSVNFFCSGLPVALGVGGWLDLGGGWLDWGGGGWGTPHTCAHTCMHMHKCTHACGKHDNFMQMATPIGGIPGNSLWCHVCVHVHVHACMCLHVHICRGHPLTTPHPHPPTPHPLGGTPGISQNSIALKLIKIFQFHLKIWNLWRLPHPWVSVWFGGWVGGWMGGVRSNH